jgi:hypothetical protein
MNDIRSDSTPGTESSRGDDSGSPPSLEQGQNPEDDVTRSDAEVGPETPEPEAEVGRIDEGASPEDPAATGTIDRAGSGNENATRRDANAESADGEGGNNGGPAGSGAGSTGGDGSSRDDRHPEYPPYSAIFVSPSKLPGFLQYAPRAAWNARVIPADQNKMLFAFDEVCAVLRARFNVSSSEFEAEFKRLQTLAQMTFNSRIARLDAGELGLEAYKKELIQREGATIKNGYLKELAHAATKACIWIVLMAIVITVILSSAKSAWLAGTPLSTVVEGLSISDRPVNPALALYFALFLVSTMWGVWLSFSVRSVKLEFSQLQHVEEDMLKPWARLLTVGLLSFVLLLLFYLKAFELKVGEASTEHIFDNLLVSMFAGLCFGFIDKLLPTQVGQKMKQFTTGAQS